MNKRRILVVDDDPRLLKSFVRVLSSRFDVVTAETAAPAMVALSGDEVFSIVISDYKMPGMNGVDFLSWVSRKSPDTVRILLTGYAELDIAIRAVNEGNIFRLLQKPCPPDALAKAIMDGLRYFELAASKRELMEKTVQESVGVLGSLISLVKPEVYGRISRIRPHVRRICQELNPPAVWEAVTGANLSMIGFIVLPGSIVEKDLAGRSLGPKDQALFDAHPAFGAKFIGKIPRMEEVARIIAYQEKRFDGGGVPQDGLKGEDIPFGARALKICLDFDRAVAGGRTYGEALNDLAGRESWYDPDVFDVMFSMLGENPAYCERKVYLHGLEPGMIVVDDIVAKRGENEIKLLAAGQEISEMAIEYLERFAANYDIPQPIKVSDPVACSLLENPDAQAPK